MYILNVLRFWQGRSYVFTTRRYASMVYTIVVCLSLCVSVTFRYWTKMAKRRITQIMLHDSPVWCQKGALNAGGVG